MSDCDHEKCEHLLEVAALAADNIELQERIYVLEELLREAWFTAPQSLADRIRLVFEPPTRSFYKAKSGPAPGEVD